MCFIRNPSPFATNKKYPLLCQKNIYVCKIYTRVPLINGYCTQRLSNVQHILHLYARLLWYYYDYTYTFPAFCILCIVFVNFWLLFRTRMTTGIRLKSNNMFQFFLTSSFYRRQYPKWQNIIFRSPAALRFQWLYNLHTY